jgi:hypothetical protein
VNISTFAVQFSIYDAKDFNPNPSAIDSSTYEHLFKSVTEKYLLFVATNSNFPFLSLNRHADAAILLASVASTKLSPGSGNVNLVRDARLDY